MSSHHPQRWKERNVAHDRDVHHWRITDGSVPVGRIELRHGMFVAIDVAGAVVGAFGTLHDARHALEHLHQVND